MSWTVEVYFDNQPTYKTTASFDRMMQQFGAFKGHAVEDEPHRRRWVVLDRHQASRALQHLCSPTLRAAIWENVDDTTPA